MRKSGKCSLYIVVELSPIDMLTLVIDWMWMIQCLFPLQPFRSMSPIPSPNLYLSVHFRWYHSRSRRNQWQHMWHPKISWKSSWVHSVWWSLKRSSTNRVTCKSWRRSYPPWTHKQFSTSCRRRCSIQMGSCESKAQKRGNYKLLIYYY